MAIFEKFIPGLHRFDEHFPTRNSILLSKAGRTLVLVLLFAFTPLALPTLEHRLSLKGQTYREILPDARELIAFRHQSAPATSLSSLLELGEAQAAIKPAAGTCRDQLIEDPEHTLDAFNSHLLLTEQRNPGTITRIVHYGDSPITNDGITGTVRELLQKRFGDSGHGFILVDRPWDWYGHQSIEFQTGGGWSSASLMAPKSSDGKLGLGGVVSSAYGPGKWAQYRPSSIGSTGKKFSRMDVYYLDKPGGGRFTVSANGREEVISTDSNEQKPAFYQFSAAEGVSSFELRTLEGDVSLFGVVLENDDPGVVYDSLGVNGAFAGLLATTMNGPHWTEQLQHRNPNLVILNYGTNESEYASDDQMQRYDRELREVVNRVRRALPGASILIVSPMDRGKRVPGGRVVTMPSIPKIVDMQRRVAVETHCAFLNLFAAMGGDGTMARWHEGKKHLVGGDLTHPNAEGAQTVGNLIYMALMEDYDNFREKQRIVKK